MTKAEKEEQKQMTARLEELAQLADSERRIKRRAKEKRLKKDGGVDSYSAGDYAGMTCDNYMFYYGYEHTLCPAHGYDEACGCDESEWCFVASERDTGDEICRMPSSDLVVDGRDGDIRHALLRGIGRFINEWLVGRMMA